MCVFVSQILLNRALTEIIKGANNMKELAVLKSVERLCEGAFMNMPYLKAAILNDGLQVLGNYAFKGTKLK